MHTRYTYCFREMEGRRDGMPNTMSPHFSSKRRGTITLLSTGRYHSFMTTLFIVLAYQILQKNCYGDIY